MRILVLCEKGVNRSVTIASHLKWWGHDVLSAGTETNSAGTLGMLIDWADRVIYTEANQLPLMVGNDKFQLWDIGPDVYPRPFNKELLKKVRALMEQNKAEYKP